jgi:ATP-dependent helicase/nuclease subunit A
VHVDNEKLNSLPKLDIIEAEELKKSLKEILSFKYAHTLATHIPAKFSVSRLTPTVLDEDRYLGELVKKAGSKESPIDGFLKDRDVTEASGYVHNEAKALSRDNSPDLDVPSFMKENAQPSGAEKGTATHLFMQFCDLMDLSADRLEAEINRLVEKRFILEAHAKLVNRDAVKRFLSSDIFNEIRSAAYVEREYRFNIKLGAADFTENQAVKDALSDEYLFVQGVIDCYFKDENGNITLVDYKTDYVPSEFRASKESEDLFFKDRYGDQLLYYKKALKILTGKEVQRTVIYSFHLGRSIEI